MELPIRSVELDRAARTDAVRRTRHDRRDEPFELDPDGRRKHGREEPAPDHAHHDDEQRVAPRTNDEVGSHLDVTA